MVKKVNTKTVKIFEDVHTRLKVHAAKTKNNITVFVSDAVLEKIANDKQKK